MGEIQREVPAHLRARYRVIKSLCHWLDEGIEIPIIKYRIGIDPILGLLWGYGSAVSLGLSIYVLWLMRGFGLPRREFVWMSLNIVFDFALGLVFGWGQAADFFYKGNIRNWRRFSRYFFSTP